MLGLPDDVTVCLFDLDGVLTKTAEVHAAAWRDTFDPFLERRSEREGRAFPPFDASDYDTYVDGRIRADGVRAFLASRGLSLPEGTPTDGPDALTVNGLGNRKNRLLLERIHRDGVEVYEGSRRYLEAARRAGMRTAVVSSSANTADVVAVTGLDRLLDSRVDGVVAAEEGLAGKPAPDTYLEAASRLAAPPASAAVFEDAIAGVAAGRAGGFAAVVGVDRVGQAEALRAAGATVVVADLAELLAGQ